MHYRFDTHIMMGLAHGKVSECTARLALAQRIIKVGYYDDFHSNEFYDSVYNIYNAL